MPGDGGVGVEGMGAERPGRGDMRIAGPLRVVIARAADRDLGAVRADPRVIDAYLGGAPL